MRDFTVPYCGGCRVPCCNQYHGIRPVLMPWEEEKSYFGLTDRVGRLTVLKVKASGDCVFFKDGKCAVYERRPFECRVYPLVLDLSSGVQLTLDDRAACARFIPPADGREFLQNYADKEIPRDWARAYGHYTAHRREKKKRRGR